ncbi:MAG: NADH-quinone oxidoreductase subunit A [Pseudomonadota bacterium]
MNTSMDSGQIALIMLFALAAATGAGIMVISAIIGRRKAPPERALPYECGLDPVGTLRHRLSVKFFLVAVLFLIFDVEVVFFYPWALAFGRAVRSGSGMILMVEMAIFLAVLLLALVYAWGKGALEWED